MRWWLPGLVPVAGAGCPLPDDDFDRDGFAIADRDCDDLDPERHPAAPEIPGDGVDQDCDGRDPEMQAVGDGHVCLLVGGRVACGGDNTYGQLDAPPLDHVVQIAAGDHHTCALSADGSVACWGDDRYGQASPPEEARFVAIDADLNWSLGEDQAGIAICWGSCRVARPR